MEPLPFTNQIANALMPTILAILGILGSIAVVKLDAYLKTIRVKTGVEIDAKYRDGLMTGVRNAILLILSRAAHGGKISLGGQLVEAAILSPEMQVLAAAERVEQKYPDATAHFGLTLIDIAEMAEAAREKELAAR